MREECTMNPVYMTKKRVGDTTIRLDRGEHKCLIGA